METPKQHLERQLTDKMAEEQEKYREWLLSLPPEEILKQTYSYTVRQDILLAWQDCPLTVSQIKALLRSPTPLVDIEMEFNKRETDYMETLADCITERAKIMESKKREDFSR